MNEEKMLVNLTLFLKGSAFEALVSYTRGAEPYVTLSGVLDHMRQTFDRRPETTDALVKNLNQGLEENIRQFLVRLVIQAGKCKRYYQTDENQFMAVLTQAKRGVLKKYKSMPLLEATSLRQIIQAYERQEAFLRYQHDGSPRGR